MYLILPVTFATLMSVASRQEKSAPQRCQRLFGEMKSLNIGMSIKFWIYELQI